MQEDAESSFPDFLQFKENQKIIETLVSKVKVKLRSFKMSSFSKSASKIVQTILSYSGNIGTLLQKESNGKMRISPLSWQKCTVIYSYRTLHSPKMCATATTRNQKNYSKYAE